MKTTDVPRPWQGPHESDEPQVIPYGREVKRAEGIRPIWDEYVIIPEDRATYNGIDQFGMMARNRDIGPTSKGRG